MSRPVKSVSPHELCAVITGATSQDHSQVQASSKRLKELLDLFGTFDGLSEIAEQKDLPLQIRQQAIIQFKNAALSHWKSRKLLSDEHRMRIRARCLTFVNEEDDLIAQCNEVITAKLARADFPSHWPTLISDLVGMIDANIKLHYSSATWDPRITLVLKRSLRILNEILKEFASVKMPGGIRVMSQLVENLHLVFCDYYSQISSTIASTLNSSTISSPQMAENILLGHLVFKILVKMATWLWNKSGRMGKDEMDKTQAWLEKLFQNSAVQLKSLTEIRINLVLTLHSSGVTPDPATRNTIDILTRHIRLFGKFFRRLQQLAVARFVALPMCGDLVLYYWAKVVQATDGPPELISDTNEAVFPVRFMVQALVLFKESLTQWTPLRKDGSPNEHTLSQSFVENAVRLLVTRFISLNASDLGGWMADPEEWINLEDQENDQWEYHLRPCGERVLVTFSQQYKQYVTPLLETTFNQIIAQPTADLPSIIQKEALYCAIGRCASRLKDVIPFDEWLQHTLLPESQETNPNYPIIKRRIAWLIGKWISDECSTTNNPNIWEVLVHLLKDRGPGTDAVVRLAASVAVRQCVDSVDFNADVFAPFLHSTVTELVLILGEAEALETKRRIANSLNTVIETAEYRIVPLITTVASPLPQLWKMADTDWLLKASLLTVVSTLIGSAKEHSMSLGGIVIPLVLQSLEPGALVHLDEDGLLLWQSAIRNSLTIQSVNGDPALLDLYPRAMDLLANNMDLLGRIISIHESYFLLDGQCILEKFAVNLFHVYLTSLSNKATLPINMKDMIVSIDLLLQFSSSVDSTLWGEALHNSGLFAHLLRAVIDGEAQTTLLLQHVYLMARIALLDRQMFIHLMSATAAAQGTQESYLWDGLLDQWWDKFDNMGEPRHRKLAAMGIASLVATGRPEVLQRLPTEIFNMWMDVFGEIKEKLDIASDDRSSSPGSLRRYWDEDEAPDSYFNGSEGTPEYERRKVAYNCDPVRTTQLSTYVAAMLQSCEAACGGAQVFNEMYLVKADPLVLGQIRAELIKG